MEIRIATKSDAQSIRNIYAPYVENTAISFEYEVPSIEEFENRIEETLEKYPYLVAIEDGIIVGYAYASAFHPRVAYSHCAELSVYVDMNHRRKGIGSKLYSELEKILISQNIYMVHACIAITEKEDEHLNNDSQFFHEKMGFKLSAKHELCGYKFCKWYSVIWMDKLINNRPDNPEEFMPFESINRRNN